MKVYKCDTKVVTNVGKIEATITAITIRYDQVMYELTYVLNGELKYLSMQSNEFSTDQPRSLSIGFN